MPLRHAPGRGPRAVLAALALLGLASCGTDDGLGRRYAVSGSVTYNDKPLEKGVISFVPEDGRGIGANGVIEAGSYALATAAARDGARAGKYKVTITAREDSAEKAKADFRKVAGKGGPAFVPRQFVSKAAAEAKNLIPAGYGDVRSTTLVAEVQERSNAIDFKLTDADAPPAPKAIGPPPKGPARR